MDTGIVAKTKRVSTKWEEFMRKMKTKKVKSNGKKKTVRRCGKCGFKVRSSNPEYIKVRMQRHREAMHP